MTVCVVGGQEEGVQAMVVTARQLELCHPGAWRRWEGRQPIRRAAAAFIHPDQTVLIWALIYEAFGVLVEA